MLINSGHSVSGMTKIATALVVTITLWACINFPIKDTPPEVVRAFWDPNLGNLPTPTNLVLDNDSGRLNLPLENANSPAEFELYTYLNSLDGYPLSSTVEIPLSDKLASQNLADNIWLFELETRLNVPFWAEIDTSRNVLVIEPDKNAGGIFKSGHTYVYALRGYASGVQGLRGELVVADAGFDLIRSRVDLNLHPDAVPGDSRQERIDTVNKLEEIRQTYQSYFEALELIGIPREELAVAGAFTTSSKPALLFDANAGTIPMPNNLLLDRKTQTIALPVAATDSPVIIGVKAGLNSYSGFSTSGAITLKTSQPIAPPSETGSNPIRIFMVKNSIEEFFDFDTGVSDDGMMLWAKPRLAFEYSSSYVFLVSNHLVAQSGEPLEAQTLGALLLARSPIYQDGQATIDGLNSETAAKIEAARLEIAPVIDFLESQEKNLRQELIAAVPFRTLAAPELALELRTEVYRQAPSTALTNLLSATPKERGIPFGMAKIETILSGELTTLNYLDPFSRQWRESEPSLTSIAFVMTIPKGCQPTAPCPVVLFGHGLHTSRELVYLIANHLAEANYATFAIDFPYHGQRSTCQTDDDCIDAGVCQASGSCLAPDGGPGQIKTVSLNALWPDGPSFPITSGKDFLRLDSPLAARDHFRQSLVDLFQTVRVLKAQTWSDHLPSSELTSQNPLYLGTSLGGIMGSLLAAIEPELTNFALNVPGSDFITLMSKSGSFQTDYEEALEKYNISLGTSAYTEFENVMRWVIDPVDPLNLVKHVILEPLTYTDPLDQQIKKAPKKRVLIQMALGDKTIPNICTRHLAEKMGITLVEYAPGLAGHSFLVDPITPSASMARKAIVEFFNDR